MNGLFQMSLISVCSFLHLRFVDKEINLDEIDFAKEKVKTLKKILMEKFDDPCKVKYLLSFKWS